MLPLLFKPSFDFLITCWRFDRIPTQIPVYFIDFLRNYYQSHTTLRFIADLPSLNSKALLSNLSGYSDPNDLTSAIWNGKISTFITLFQHSIGADSSFEACILCPYSNVQIECLNALNARWGFVMQAKTRSEMMDDVRSKMPSGVACLVAEDGGKVQMILYVSRDLHDRFTAPALRNRLPASKKASAMSVPTR